MTGFKEYSSAAAIHNSSFGDGCAILRLVCPVHGVPLMFNRSMQYPLSRGNQLMHYIIVLTAFSLDF